ncbi:MAG: DUF2281 domain-containing protein [Chloroherpetonaceae bacterium]|nr:DUF2281 domain-containing protein [Chloroherpetonaceae bacterium]
MTPNTTSIVEPTEKQLSQEFEAALKKLTQAQAEEVLHFVEFLIHKSNAPAKEPHEPLKNEGNQEPESKRSLEPLKGAFGKMADDFDAPVGIFVLPLPKDFDEPLDSFKDYMK